MTYPNSHIDVAHCGRIIYARITGLGNMRNCMNFQDFCTEMLDRGYYDCILVDLGPCTGMDSTFLGVLAGLATHVKDRKRPTVVIINASPENIETMNDVGLTNFVEIRQGHTEIPPITTHRIDDSEDIPPKDRLQFIKEAHEALLRLGNENEEKFGPLIKAIDAELNQKK